MDFYFLQSVQVNFTIGEKLILKNKVQITKLSLTMDVSANKLKYGKKA